MICRYVARLLMAHPTLDEHRGNGHVDRLGDLVALDGRVALSGREYVTFADGLRLNVELEYEIEDGQNSDHRCHCGWL